MNTVIMAIATLFSIPLFFIGAVAAFLWKGVSRGYEMWMDFFNHAKNNM